MPRIPTPKPSEPIKIKTLKSGAITYEVNMLASKGGAKRSEIRRRFPTLAAARAFVETTRVELREGSFTPTTGTTLAELTEAWLKTRRDVREVTVQGYRQAMAGVLKAHGSRRVQTLTEPEIQRWVDSWPATGGVRGRGQSHRSVCYSLVTLKQVLAYGVKTKIIAANPAAGVKAPRKTAADRKDKIIWTVPQMRAFLNCADADELAAAWRLVCSGMRRSEVLGARWSDTDIDAGTVTVAQGRVKAGVKKATAIDDPKSAASARIVDVESIHPGTMALLRELKVRQAADRLAVGGWSDDITRDLIVVNAAGEPLHPDSFGSRFRSLCQRAGVPVIAMHNTRHTLASLLHDANVPPAVAAELLGHETATHLAYYVKPVKGARSRAAERLGGLLAAAGE